MKRKPITPMKYPTSHDAAYRRILLTMNKQYKIILKKNMSPYVEAMAEEATAIHLVTGEIKQDAVRQDEGWRTTLGRIMNRIQKDMTEPTNKAIKEMIRLGPRINEHNKAEWQKLIRSQYGVNPTKEDPEKYMSLMKNWSRNNSLLIKDIPFKTSHQIAELTREALVKGTNQKDVTDQIYDIMSDRTDVSDSRAKLIARDQVSKLNGNLTRERQTDLGVSGYIWRTVGDERVRDTHEDNDGELFSWDSPPATGHPGEDIQCRCWAEPVLPEFAAFEASLLEDA